MSGESTERVQVITNRLQARKWASMRLHLDSITIRCSMGRVWSLRYQVQASTRTLASKMIAVQGRWTSQETSTWNTLWSSIQARNASAQNSQPRYIILRARRLSSDLAPTSTTRTPLSRRASISRWSTHTSSEQLTVWTWLGWLRLMRHVACT